MHPEPIYASVVRIAIVSQNVQFDVPEHSRSAHGECLMSPDSQLVCEAAQKLFFVAVSLGQALKFNHDKTGSKDQTLEISKQV